MRATARLAIMGLWRTPGRTLLRLAVLAAAVSLLGSMLLFVYDSLGTMTATAVRSVPLDWQGPVGSYAQATRAAAATAREADVQQAAAAATAPFAGSTHVSTAVGTVRSSGGSILAVPTNYPGHFRTMRFLRGGLVPGQIVLDQQLAATLQAGVGDTITITPTRGSPARSFRVSGVALVTAPDVVFQPLNPLLGPAPAQPPAEVIVMPLATFARTLGPAYSSAAGSSSTAAVPGAQTGVQWQVQAQVRPASLTGAPNTALATATQIRNRVERDLLGRVQFVDNLGDGLNSAAGDALYAETLYIMLAVPGAIVALGLAYLAALGTVERDRRDLALLRSRGATRRQLVVFATLESVIVGILAGLAGAGVALLAVRWAIGTVPVTVARALALVGGCVLLATLGAAAARLGAGIDAFRASISEGRRRVRRGARPLWQRLYLDLIALGVSGLIYWLTASTGFSAVVNPDSNPTLSLSVYMFFAPALLWVGATLLLVRLRGRLLAAVASRAGGQRATTMRGFLLASAGRRGAAINRGLIVVGLLLAFGVNLGVFAATYSQQALVDAQLTLGADVVATGPAGASSHKLQSMVRSVAGVQATTPIDHAYAYVGPDLQDTFGIDPHTFTSATSLRDSYFLGSTAQQAMSRLAATRDGILVSKETITDYQLRLGDLLKLRVLDHATGTFRVAPFHVVGVVQEFPSAPKDSFMVTNLAYLDRVTHAPGPNVVFARATSDPAKVAVAVARAVKPLGATVKDITHQVRQTTSSITTVDLTGISRIERAFVIVLAAAAMALFVALGMAERRHELAAMAAVGASVRQVAAFLWTEAMIVLGAGLLLAVGLGWLLSEMLVAMLQHVFDPPPDHLTVPWGFLGGMAAAAVLTGVLASAIAIGRLGRMSLGAILREE
jgi:putative ABC transport system permease protein